MTGADCLGWGRGAPVQRGWVGTGFGDGCDLGVEREGRGWVLTPRFRLGSSEAHGCRGPEKMLTFGGKDGFGAPPGFATFFFSHNFKYLTIQGTPEYPLPLCPDGPVVGMSHFFYSLSSPPRTRTHTHTHALTHVRVLTQILSSSCTCPAPGPEQPFPQEPLLLAGRV